MKAPFSTVVPGFPDERRVREPVSVGVPLPQGAVSGSSRLAVVDSLGAPVPSQYEVLDRWPDNSIRWALLDCQLNVPETFSLTAGEEPAVTTHPDPVSLTCTDDRWTVITGDRRYVVEPATAHILRTQKALPTSAAEGSVVMHITAGHGAALHVRFDKVTEECRGPLRSTLCLSGVALEGDRKVLDITCRISWFAGLETVRLDVTVRNPRRARHAGGYWELGDPGSVFLKNISLAISDGSSHDRALCSTAHGESPIELPLPLVLHQESSGGDNWQSPVHVNRFGNVPLRFRGYRLVSPGEERMGERATPVLWFPANGRSGAAVAVRHFWQNFPKALEAAEDRLSVQLFPGDSADLHELQGGEQKTHVVGVSFGGGEIAERPLDWILRPALAGAPPEWYAAAKAAPHLSPTANPRDARYEQLLNSVVEGPDSFERKRERIDEYGWRNFGDIYADHEDAFRESGAPYISHYNNQYDAIGGFALQFMRTGDPRWWQAMDELARHVADIDIYHASDDKSAYNGGPFWHTYHYVDAGKSNHRAYPALPGVSGGGPSNEHDYTTGLMLYFFMTGQPWARDTVLALAEWVLRIDDGRLTPFRWLSGSATGLASSTFSTLYHGPGRGPGNSIVTLLNASRLTGDARYLHYAEALIRRCIHPSDDIASRDLLNAEARWSYTVFLQALGRYLDTKAIHNQLDCHFAYARASLLHYARWMVDHEYPYLEKPEILEYPTETWAAQDMRKSDVLTLAALYSDTSDRSVFLDRAEFFFRASLDWLYRFPSRVYARPVIILLSCGYLRAIAGNLRLPAAPNVPNDCEHGNPQKFVPQKQLAIRRATSLLALLAGCLLVALSWITVRFIF